MAKKCLYPESFLSSVNYKVNSVDALVLVANELSFIEQKLIK